VSIVTTVCGKRGGTFDACVLRGSPACVAPAGLVTCNRVDNRAIGF
jgi:hypothetical protein